jgi:hypothetical protein
MLPHKHTGRIATHRHTSYAGLFFVLLVMSALLLGVSVSAVAAPPATNPQSGSVGLTGIVRGPAPKTAAQILTPKTGTRTSTTPITVSGTCPQNSFVSVSKNNSFGGVVQCGDDGTFSLLVDLFAGLNSLVAKVSDALGQYGPDSNPVTIFYDSPVLSQPGGSVGRQMILEMTTTVAATNPGQPIDRTVTLVGGVGPYAVSWDFGDGQTALQSAASEGDLTQTHKYDRSGTYTVIVKVTDSARNSAFMQFVTIVNGVAQAVGSNKGSGLGALPGTLLTAWPLWLLAVLMVFFFWLGERRELHKLRARNLLP